MSIPPAVVEAVHDRACGYCEACGWPAAGKMDLHHRKLRSHGGEDTVANLLYVHHECHVLSPYSIHQNPKRSYRLKHMLKTREDPESRPAKVCIQLRNLRRF